MLRSIQVQLGVKPGLQQLRAFSAHLVSRLVDDGQGRVEQGRPGGIIKTNDRDLCRDMLSLLADCSDSPDGPYPCGEYQAFHLWAEIELHK